MSFRVDLEKSALIDVQAAIDYYDNQKAGLGRKFEAELNEFLISLETHPFYQTRYNQVRCLPLRKFPFYGSFFCL